MKKIFSLLVFFVSSTLFATDALKNSQAFQDDKLIFAIDVIRHGDRNPTIDIPTEPHHWVEGLGQ